jgi:ABC-type branched-subunit amino acid transport system ATPase component
VAEVLLEVEGLTKRFGGVIAADQISLAGWKINADRPIKRRACAR